MRRLNLALAVVMIALLAGPVAVLAASNASYRDKFDGGGYGGSDGSLFWAPDWTEIGENDGSPNSGSVQVSSDQGCASNECLNLLGNVGAWRQADTSRLTGIELSYRPGARCTLTCLLGLLGTLRTEVRAADGTWVMVRSESVAALGGDEIELVLSDAKYSSENFAVRFLVSGLSVGSRVLIDDVEIEGEIPATTTSSTTTTTSSTTSITLPTITVPSITTTTLRTTTTTTPRSATTTEPSTDTTTSAQTTTSEDRQSATSTTVAGVTTTTSNDDGSVVALGPGEPPEGGGSDEISLHQATRGIQAGLSGALFADVALVPVLDPVDVDLNFGLFAEEIETSWLWMTLFGLVLTWALVSDLDRRRFKGLRARAPSRVVS